MPHSSGGGSHSGCSGSSSSSSSTGGSSENYYTSYEPFEGAYRYRRTRYGQEEYVYSTNPALDKSRPSIFIIIFLGFFLLIGIGLIADSISAPRKLSNSYKEDIRIEDDLELTALHGHKVRQVPGPGSINLGGTGTACR